MEANQSEPIQTIRLSDKEKEKLIWAINEAPNVNVGHDPDRLRVTATHTNAVLSLPDEASQALGFSVVAYSHGRRGISLVHGRYIHPSTRCKVRFQSLSGEWHERTGHTGQCIHVQGLIHALLVVFDEPINLDEFALLTAEQETQHLHEISQEVPNMDSDDFAGLVSKILFIDDQPSDRKLVNYWLNRSGMQVTTVASVESAYQQIEQENYDLLIVDMLLGHDSGIDVIRHVRNNRFVQPVLAVSAEEQPKLEADALAAGANAFLLKPFTQEQLITTAKKLMGFDPDSDNSPIYSTFSNDPEMVPLLTGYVRSLDNKIREMREANGNNNYELIQKLASSLKGCGTGYGYPDITSAATAVLSALDDDMPDIDEIKRMTNALVVILSRIKLPQAAPQAEPSPEEYA